ncbi:uncharacterized protein LOC122400510 [Colletes gigas]|uniref:uncharacterized protein LOC122400510 n=1 Tax=Colletes gigas TaxID=935657 RepID=UPI001C9AFD87|nr:uncharacterized protein LOC122400510 [Colletes gigas]
MAERAEGLFIQQVTTIAAIRRVIVNYKKLPKAQVSLARAKNRKENLEKLWDECRATHQLILQSTKAEDHKGISYFKDNTFLDAEDAYFDAEDFLSDAIAQLDVGSKTQSDQSNVSICHDSVASASSQLPRLSLPKFSGDFNQWGNFRGLFESLVDSNKSLTNIQKLHYLKTNVTGDAALLIDNINMSDESYEAAWKLLVDEYEDETALINSHIHKFISLPSMKTELATELKRLRDTVTSSLTALKNLNRAVDSWDDLLVYLIAQKFSKRTRDEWNLHRGSSKKYPTYKEINEFMTLRIRGLTDYLAASDSPSYKNKVVFDASRNRSSVNNVSVVKCVDCSGDHMLFKCERFKAKSLDQRVSFVKQNRLCFNCLRFGHLTSECKSTNRCFLCKRTHHSLLHRAATSLNKTTSNVSVNDSVDKANASDATNKEFPASVQTVSSSKFTSPNTLLATAWIVLRTAEGRAFKLRALLDQGSSFSFISESVCQLMRTKRHRARLQIQCFGEQYSGVAKSRVLVQLESCHNSKISFPLSAHVYQRITSYAGSRARLDLQSWPHLRDLPLADPNPLSGHPIHVLIGADLYGSLLLNDLRQGPVGTPTAQLTALGWIISGPTGPRDSRQESPSLVNCVSAEELDYSLRRFWELEEVPSRPSLSEEDEKCERFFHDTHTRSPQGRYIVRLPFKSTPPFDLEGSREVASRFYAKLEQRLLKQPDLESQYHDFLSEYLSMGHMEQIEEQASNISSIYYIPHHPVVRPSSSTTKLRVVFNASAKANSGQSLNDYLLIGPKLQRDLAAIILRWRLFRYVYTADIAKMFRQILINPADADYQRILWRPCRDQPILSYRLLTVTYGLASAPYLAIKVLDQLALDEGSNLPAATPVVQDSIYVDDAIFVEGGFQLRKWAANAAELLENIPPSDRESTSDHPLGEDESQKVLGVTWNPSEDTFRFRIDFCLPAKGTKRNILSIVSKIFDPLGWASPVIIVAKLMLQELWLLNKDWDDEIPADLCKKWHEYCEHLSQLREVRIPRWTGVRNNNVAIELHGFADASHRAYAAVVYLRVLHSLSEAQVALLTAKSKVAPLKTISIPRLELNAVVLLTRLLEWTLSSLKFQSPRVYGWTDSTVVLAWLKQHPSTWNTFVANRVSDVQTRLPQMTWKHVRSQDNPADCASRGICASELAAHKLWWSGPDWLSRPSVFWPDHNPSNSIGQNTRETALSESRKSYVHHASPLVEWDLPSQYSSWTRLRRVTAYILRFTQRTRKKLVPLSPYSRLLTVDEIRAASLFWMSYVQKNHFNAELKLLKSKMPLPKSSPLISLHPVIGKDSLIRLGGRLEHSALSYDEKHPIVLPKHRVSELLIDHVHKRTLHGGIQLTLRVLRQQYWIISARSLVRGYIHRCVTCVRQKAQSATQLMGALPDVRVKPSAPFSHTGLDYAGPINILPIVGRGQKTRKYYIAVFICLATKAVHLELVEDCTTPAFLAALKRFASRRGLPTFLYSDNGTNFRGADRELQRTFHALIADAPLKSLLATDGVTWKFIPPAAPHFGGLWEAGVKSVKYHLKRAVGAHTLSQIEFSTVLCQIEACLNSRPMSALTDEPTDLSALTPGHFLIGRPIVAVPEESTLDINPNRLDRWQHVRRISEQIWRSWSADYLHSLHQRRKWQQECANLRLNELVILKDSSLPPSKWQLARITRLHPGSDQRVRVVTIRTVDGELKRPVTQICPLPIPVSNESDLNAAK